MSLFGPVKDVMSLSLALLLESRLFLTLSSDALLPIFS